MPVTTGNREDYLIAILRLTEGGSAAKTTELAEHMGVSPASVSEMLKILSKDGLVEYAKYRGVRLTEKGYTDARLTRKRHHIVEKFFIDVLGLEPEIAHQEAHRIEHTISDSAAQRICDILGNPPDCDCQSCVNPCKSVSGFGISITFQLCDADTGRQGTVAYIKSDDSKVMEKLLAMGIIPGRDVTVTGRDDEKEVVTLSVGDCSIAVDRKMASYVYLDMMSE
ncbi:MAG: metal-dependent transcriptional regulator [Candidatus Methanomethylophilus sp.]|nr:metal-dependent transcriptional regulator [Methanomethylophilus sp.]